MKKVQFYESEYPYDTLEKFGLTREMIEDLPMHVLDDLSAGLRSPVLPIKVKTIMETKLHAGLVSHSSIPMKERFKRYFILH